MGLKIVCNETGCNSQFSKIKYLRDHLISVHKQIHEPEQVIEFESESKLDAFKAELHKQSVCFTSNGTKHRGGGKIVQ